eukprot:scaffold62566_cov41-Prasinocladus_malaysianus.AAC.1
MSGKVSASSESSELEPEYDPVGCSASDSMPVDGKGEERSDIPRAARIGLEYAMKSVVMLVSWLPEGSPGWCCWW